MCSECEIEKEESEFSKRTDNGRLASNCKVCKRNYKKAHYQSNKYEPSERWRYLLNRAKIRNLDVTLTFEQFKNMVGQPCAYCGDDTSKNVGSGLDRLNNSLGYSLDNVVVCCAKCNFGKTDRFSPEEWTVMIKALKEWRS